MREPIHIEAPLLPFLYQLIQKITDIPIGNFLLHRPREIVIFITIYYTEFIYPYLHIPISASNSSIFHFLTSFPVGFSTKDTVFDRVSPLM